MTARTQVFERDSSQRPHRPQKSLRAIAAAHRCTTIDASGEGNLGNSSKISCGENFSKYSLIGPTSTRRHFSASRYSLRVQMNAKNNSCMTSPDLIVEGRHAKRNYLTAVNVTAECVNSHLLLVTRRIAAATSFCADAGDAA
jgi:hypothetical protein